MDATTLAQARRSQSVPATTEPRRTRILLTAVALSFLALFLVVPLVAVFSQALEKGLAAYFDALREPMLIRGDADAVVS